MITIINIVFFLWLIFCNKFCCVFLKYLVILIFRTILNDEKSKVLPSYYYLVYCWNFLFNLQSLTPPYSFSNTSLLVFFRLPPIVISIQILYPVFYFKCQGFFGYSVYISQYAVLCSCRKDDIDWLINKLTLNCKRAGLKM